MTHGSLDLTEAPADPGIGVRLPGVDTPRAVAAASYLTGLNQLAANLQPVLLGAMATSYGIPDSALGQISASFIGLNTVFMMGAPFWIRRVNWRNLALVGSMLAAIAAASGGWAATLPSLLLLFAMMGAVQALVGAPAFTALGDNRNPDRAFGLALAAQSGLAALAAVPLSTWIIPAWGAPGVFVVLAVILATGVPASLWLPPRGRFPVTEAAVDAAARPILSIAALPALLALIGVGLFVAGALGFWFFAERIGGAREVPGTVIGATISLSAFATIAAAAIVAAFGPRVPSLGYIAGGTAIVLCGLGLLALPGTAAYVGSVVMFSLGYGVAQPGYWSIARKVDMTGRIFTATPAVSGIAGVTIGLAAGPIIDAGGYDSLVTACALCATSGVAAAVIATLLTRSPERTLVQA